jgi:hypothetical protein
MVRLKEGLTHYDIKQCRGAIINAIATKSKHSLIRTFRTSNQVERPEGATDCRNSVRLLTIIYYGINNKLINTEVVILENRDSSLTILLIGVPKIAIQTPSVPKSYSNVSL